MTPDRKISIIPIHIALGEINMEIDIFSLLKSVLKRWYLVLLSALLGAGILFVYSYFFITPTYTSSSTLYISMTTVSDGIEKQTSNDVAAAQRLATSYAAFFQSSSVSEAVADQMNNQYSARQIQNSTSVEVPEDTQIITVSISTSNAKTSQTIASLIVSEGIKKIQEVSNSDNIAIIDEADLPTAPSSPNIMLNTILGFIVGLLISVVVICIFDVYNTRIKSPQDFADTFKDIAVIGVIPKMQED